ncbi:hypothetical protein Tco_1162620 [Tanacetum coccineum]
MMIYLKNMAGYKMGYFKGMSYGEIRPMFEEEYNKIQTLFKKDTKVEKTKTKRVTEEILLQESFKKLRATEASRSEPIQEQSTEEPKELSEEELKKMLEIVPVEEIKAEALQIKYAIIDWEIHTEGSRKYCKIIRVRNITEAYQVFEDMLKGFDREDLVTLWRLFELDKDDVLWKLQKYMHDPLTWRLYDTCGVHHVSSTRGHDIYMLTEKDYPLSTTVMGLMLSRRLQVEEDTKMARDLVMKIFIEANKPRSSSALSEKLDWENPEGGDYPFDLSKPLPLIKRGKRQREYHLNSLSTMISNVEDMVPNIWIPVKVAYDKYTLWGISHWREQRKSFYAFARGMQSRGDVYSTKRILAVTRVSVMMKHRYGYLEEIVVRRADNIIYRFKEGDDVPDFAIALRMFTKSLVIQRLVEDLQLEVESYQKQINVTKPDTTRPYLRKRHSYTPYKDPQGFIYVDDFRRNRLMRSDELYKFSDGTLTRLFSSFEDITKNIDMMYLPKRKWSKLEKKRDHFMIKDINKLLKERRMIRSLEKFIDGRLYETDLRLLQRTI